MAKDTVFRCNRIVTLTGVTVTDRDFNIVKRREGKEDMGIVHRSPIMNRVPQMGVTEAA